MSAEGMYFISWPVHPARGKGKIARHAHGDMRMESGTSALNDLDDLLKQVARLVQRQHYLVAIHAGFGAELVRAQKHEPRVFHGSECLGFSPREVVHCLFHGV